MKTEYQKLCAGEEYCFLDPSVASIKENALKLCQRFNAVDPNNLPEQMRVIKALFGSTGENVYVQPNFNCDVGSNIHVGEAFLANYNVTILDIAPVRIGDYVMIGPNTLIATVNHPMTPRGRRKRLAQGFPVTIGNDVWIGGNCTILPGVAIGNNVVVAAGAVVSKNLPDNVLAGGNPARVIRELEAD